MSEKTIPCELCGKPTNMLGSRRCNGCWELEIRVRLEPELARKILDDLMKEEKKS